MCAIAGVFLSDNKLKKDELEKAVLRMNKFQERRGPDDEGILYISADHPENHRKAAVILGNRRLSILDLSKKGHQPMGYKTPNSKLQIPDKSRNSKFRNRKADLWITYNGEIYNFGELRLKLKKSGYKFKTNTDTEVILASYAEYKERSFAMFRGMFAFALWDGAAQKLFLVKDRYGIKPLYYWEKEGNLVFASTALALKESGLVPAVADRKALIGFLAFGSIPLPLTALKDVAALPAGHYLVMEKNKKPSLVCYSDMLDNFFNKQNGGFEAAAAEVRNKLEDSVGLHLISDAPLGIFLSGGLDSSVLAALAAEGGQRLITVSVDFEEEEFSERKYQDIMAQKIMSDHRRVLIKKNDFENDLADIFEVMDQPTVDGINTFFVAKAAKQAGVKAVLSGLGSDEIFWGYPFFRRAKFLRIFQKSPLVWGSYFLSALGDRWSKMAYLLSDDILGFYLGIRGLFSPREIAGILGIHEIEVQSFLHEMLHRLPLDELEKLDPRDMLSYLELRFYLENQLLKDTDFMSMSHSIEVRVPFLDYPLVEYLSGLAPEIKLHPYKLDEIGARQRLKNVNKPLLARAAADILPPEILARSKMGFTFPFEKWLRSMLMTSNVLNIKWGELAASEVQKIEAGFKSGRLHWSRYWALRALDAFVSRL